MDLLYLILDSQGSPIAKAVLESSPEAEVLQLRVLDGAASTVAAQEGEIQLIAMDDNAPTRRGTVARRREDRLVVSPTAVLGPEARENLRIQTDFTSVIYPISGSWRGLRHIQGKDVSCGGVAFYAETPLEDREVVEMVLPITDQPLILRAKVLRAISSQGGRTLYASKFIDLIHDEEALIRKAVFSIQVSRPRK